MVLTYTDEMKEIITDWDSVKRRLANQKIDQRVNTSINDVACPKCGGNLSQTRSGSKRVKCKNCDVKFQVYK